MRGRNRLIVVGVSVVALLAGRSLLGWLFAPAAAPGLANQIWVERLQRTPRDLVHHLVLIEDGDGRHFGSTGRSSHWRVQLDFLQWSREGNRLRLTFPQDRQRLEARARTWNCKGEAPAPFELCLELSKDRRRVRLYSRKEWVIKPGKGMDGVASEVAESLPGLPAALAPLLAPGAPAQADVAEDDVSAGVFSEPAGFGLGLPAGEEAADPSDD